MTKKQQGGKSPTRRFRPPLTTSRAALLDADGDHRFRQMLYMMVTSFGRLIDCRVAFGREADLTGSQFAALMGAAYTQGEAGVTIGRLADHIQLATTHVTTEVGRLCRRGLLMKFENPDDRRSVLVRLTARGESVVRELAPFMRAINDILFDGITQSQFEKMSEFLEHFVEQTEAAILELRRHRLEE